jgi:hypothetical protein
MARVVSDNLASPCMSTLTNQYMPVALHHFHTLVTRRIYFRPSFPRDYRLLIISERFFDSTSSPTSSFQQPNTPAFIGFHLRYRATSRSIAFSLASTISDSPSVPAKVSSIGVIID